MADHPGLRIVRPRAGLRQIITWGAECDLKIAKLPSTFEFAGPKPINWRVIGPDELGIYFITYSDDMHLWAFERQRGLGRFIKKLQANSDAVYFFRNFNGTHWYFLHKEGAIPWKLVPRRAIFKFFLQNR